MADTQKEKRCGVSFPGRPDAKPLPAEVLSGQELVESVLVAAKLVRLASGVDCKSAGRSPGQRRSLWVERWVEGNCLGSIGIRSAPETGESSESSNWDTENRPPPDLANARREQRGANLRRDQLGEYRGGVKFPSRLENKREEANFFRGLLGEYRGPYNWMLTSQVGSLPGSP